MKLFTNDQIAEINLKAGAALEGLTLSNGQTTREVISKAPGYLYSSSFLFPFPNRLAEGKYHIHGSTYQFPCNDFGNPNALHGFINDREFSVSEQTSDSVTALFEYKGDLEYFPFPFSFSCKYLLEPAALSVFIEVKNTGSKSMPFGLGWHPYFYVNESVDNSMMKLPPVIQHELGEYSRPTGNTMDYPHFVSENSINEVELDDCFQITEHGSSYIRFADQSQLEIWQDPQFSFLQIYIPGDRMSVAIEPMTCGVDAWNQSEVIPTLDSGELFKGSFGVRFS